jgi:hypothetical protein
MKLEGDNWPTSQSVAMQGDAVVRGPAAAGLGRIWRVDAWEAMVLVMVLAWLVLGIPAQFSASAAPVETVAASSPASYTADLNYQETDEVLVSRPIGIKLQTAAYRKEPLLDRRNIIRGMLLWGTRSEQAIPFIWDKGQSRLYLDLNRNRDLTDDPKGVFACAFKDNNQCFTNIHLNLPTATGNRPVRLQLTFNYYGPASVNVYAGLCSYWQARISLRGTDWQFGLVEDLLADNGSLPPQWLLLRAWAERQRPFNLLNSSPDFCTITKSIFFDNRAYDLDCQYEPGGDSPKYKVAFKELAPRLGELQVTGANLHRLILTAKPGMTALLDLPAGKVKVPVGTYSVDEIWLRRGEVEVVRLKAGTVTVDSQRAATLIAGGPLTNSVEVRSYRDMLQLNYRLLGADGGAYQLPTPDYQHPPEFAVFQGTNRLATGKFQYG